jgi:hypothetical protein
MLVLFELKLIGIMALWQLIRAFGCCWLFISSDGPVHSTLVFKGFVHFIWHDDSNGCFVFIATQYGYAWMTYLTASLVFIVWLNAF